MQLLMAVTLALCTVLEVIGYEMDLNNGTMVEHPKKELHKEALMGILG